MKRRSAVPQKRSVPSLPLPATDAACCTGPFTHWLSLEQIRKMQRMRRESVARAMETGELRYERRGRIRYARLADVLAWEELRLAQAWPISTYPIAPELLDLLG